MTATLSGGWLYGYVAVMLSPTTTDKKKHKARLLCTYAALFVLTSAPRCCLTIEPFAQPGVEQRLSEKGIRA